MLKKLFPFLFILATSFGSNFLFAQEQELKKDESPGINIQRDETQSAAKTNPAPENSPRIKERLTPPPLPVMQNTGNVEKDAADYAAEKDKWINDVLALYKNRISPEQENKLREFL